MKIRLTWHHRISSQVTAPMGNAFVKMEKKSLSENKHEKRRLYALSDI